MKKITIELEPTEAYVATILTHKLPGRRHLMGIHGLSQKMYEQLEKQMTKEELGDIKNRWQAAIDKTPASTEAKPKPKPVKSPKAKALTQKPPERGGIRVWTPDMD